MTTKKHGGRRVAGPGKKIGAPVKPEARGQKKQICWTNEEWCRVRKAALVAKESVSDFQRRIILNNLG